MDLVLPLLLVAVVFLAIGGGAGWALGRARLGGGNPGAEAARAAAAAEATGLREQLAAERDRAARADAEHRRERQEAAARAQERQDVLAALAPVKDSLGRMQQQVEELERSRSTQYGALAEQLRFARESDEQLRATTESLAGALRSNSTRGVWGETQLRRVVEAAGLLPYVDFATQQSIDSDAGAGRPDMVITLPGGTSIAVDAKAPLQDYLAASAIPATATGEEEARRQTLLAGHVRALRAHVDALGKKSYWQGLGTSPEFVVAFVPSESLLSAALEADPGLLEHAFGKRVALASPVNLWAVLKTVALSWKQQALGQEAERLFELGSTLYSRLGTLADHADGLRKSIERTVQSYNAFAGSLESRVLVTARRFPGIDTDKLLAEPAAIHEQPKPFTAAELAPAAADTSGAVDAADRA